MKKRPNPFDYNNFRAYLRHWYACAHSHDPKTYTKAKICRTLGLPNSRSYFTDVLNGDCVSQLKVVWFIKRSRRTRSKAAMHPHVRRGFCANITKLLHFVRRSCILPI